MSVKKEAQYQGVGAEAQLAPELKIRRLHQLSEEPRADSELEKDRTNKEDPNGEGPIAKVEYQPKGYLRVLKKTCEEEIRPRH